MLWIGMPTITMVGGESLVSRMLPEMLAAAGLPELIVKSRKGYEAFANQLATNRQVVIDTCTIQYD
jgi:predicted O-linked N-acetylglucosamine transferase (SPINDLY family)